MANRVVFGKRPDNSIGLWISKPGFNVLDTPTQNMLFSMEDDAFQVVQSGLVWSVDDGVYDVFMPDQGFFPLILLSYPAFNSQAMWMGLSYHKISNTQFRITRNDGSFSWTDDFHIRYYVTKKPLP